MQRETRRDRGTLVIAIRACALGAILITVTACGGDLPVPSAPRLPAHISAALKDPRIGAGLPARFRQVGIEHNRLSLLTAGKLRAEARQFGDPAIRCAAIRRVLGAEAPRTASSFGVSGGEAILRAGLDRVTSGLDGCGPSVVTGEASLIATPAAGEASEEEVSYISDAAFATLDQMQDAISHATALSQVDQAFQVAAAAAATFDTVSAAAVQSAIAQSQASIVLWAPGGAGWQELGGGPVAESLFGLDAARRQSLIDVAVALAAADLAGCMGAIRFMRSLPVIQNPNLLMAACGFGAAVASVYTGYKIVTNHE